jgi:hypothetical protein
MIEIIDWLFVSVLAAVLWQTNFNKIAVILSAEWITSHGIYLVFMDSDEKLALNLMMMLCIGAFAVFLVFKRFMLAILEFSAAVLYSYAIEYDHFIMSKTYADYMLIIQVSLITCLIGDLYGGRVVNYCRGNINLLRRKAAGERGGKKG